MRTILHIIRKEILQIRRNRQILPMLTILPIVQVILLSFAANYEFRNLKLCVIDSDHSVVSQQFVQAFTASGFFRLSGNAQTHEQAYEQLQRDDADLILEIPANFSRDLVRENHASVNLQMNAVNSQKGGVSAAYALSIVTSFNEKLLASVSPNAKGGYRIEPVVVNWYNPLLNYKTLMVPGILATMVSILILMVSAMNIVREKEIGTIEQLNVTPVKKYQFIIGKLVPFWVMGHVIFWLGIAAGVLIFHVPFEGNPLVLELFLACYLPALLGLGLLVSTLVDTQQQAMFVAFFFILIFILMSGLMTPVENMPIWAQRFNVINPVKYLVEVNRLVLLKGASLNEIGNYCLFMLGYGAAIISLAVWRYRKTV